MPEETGEMTQQAYNEIVKVRRDKLKALRDAGKDPFVITKYPQTDYSATAKAGFTDVPEGQLGKAVCMAGRMMSKRVMGKASFAHLRDNEGDIQIYVRRDDVGEEAYADFKKLDIGDIIGVKGNLFRTKMGEISVHATEVTLLSKSLLPLPEKFHGLRDTELRFRQRYVDLIMNPEVRRTFEVRSKFIKFMRSYLDGMGYMEVETPVLNTISGGATARPFITHHNTLNMDMYMRIATELPLKRLIVGGLDRVYEIGRIFRNEGMDPKHNPEFTTVELYQAYADFHDMMDIAEGIISGAAKEILGTYDVEWMGYKVNLAPGWKRMTMVQAVKQYVGIDFDAVSDDAAAVAAAKAAGVELAGTADKTWGNALYACFDQKVEENLIQPTFITMYPVEVSPLSKRSPADTRLTERFELFICHSELANAFSELNDPIDQRGRFQKQVELRAKGDDEAGMMDEDYLTAMEYGLPPTGGMGIGVDRAVMMLTNSDTIREVILFPTMKTLGGVKSENGVSSKEVSTPNSEPEKIDFSKVKVEPLFEEDVDFDTFSKSDFRAVKVKECVAVPKSKKLLQFTLDDGTGTDRTILSGIHAYYEPEELVGKTLIAITNLP
ncbi:MAG: lysine--tRNA ligase, partial [Oscillospiraceae bacterium]